MEGDVLEQGIRSLVINVEKEAGSFEQAEERLKHLEEYDEDFHKYEIVKILKETIDRHLGTHIDDEIETFSVSGNDFISDQETLVSRVTEKVLRSNEFRMLESEVTSNVEGAVEKLIDQFEWAFPRLVGCKPSGGPQGHVEVDGDEVDAVPDLVGMAATRVPQPGFLSEDDESVGSSFNHGQFNFMSGEAIRKIATQLEKSNSLELRRGALDQLHHTSLNEPFTGDEELLAQLQRGLVDALLSSNADFSNDALKFVAKYTKKLGEARFSSISRELYSTLVQYLVVRFSNKAHLPKIKHRLDTKQPDMIQLLKAFRLLNEIQRNAPNFWVRYPIRFMEEMFSGTLQLLSLTTTLSGHQGNVGPVTPVHFLSLLDPRADWFNKWMHGNYSRSPLFRMLQDHRPLIQTAVASILDFVDTKRAPIDIMNEPAESVSGSYKGSSGSNHQRSAYTSSELSYIYFTHSLSVIGRLLSFSQGREFFPLEVTRKQGDSQTVSLSDLVCAMIQLINEPGCHGLPSRNLAAQYEPANLVSEVLKKLGSSEQSCSVCLCDTAVISRLIQPITSWLEGSYSSVGKQASDATYLYIADILSIVASRSEGRKHLLYGSGERLTRSSSDMPTVLNKSSAAHSLTLFTIQALKKAPPPGSSTLSNGIAAAYLYICRLLYSNAEGLHALYTYNLHQNVTESWKEARRAVEMARTPTPGDGTGHHGDSQSHMLIAWEDTLRDNLLSFAGTPKGCLLMQLSGALGDCILYMNERYRHRQQVSRLEKFGYGTMITQLASTAPGIVALHNRGFVELFIRSVWDSLEHGLVESGKTEKDSIYLPEEQQLYWPSEPVDKAAQKPFSNLLNILSSYSSVVELLYKVKAPTQASYSLREKPSTLPELLDRLLLIDAANPDPKIHSLFSYEQSHTFGLRLLSVLISCLDSLLLLQTQYQVLDHLLKLQRMEDISETGDIVIDMLSVERNYILVKGYIIGGPSERVLPPRALEDVPSTAGSPYPFPMVSSYPIPKDYVANLAGKSAMKQENELGTFLSRSKMEPRDEAWAEGCKSAFVNVITSKPEQLRGNVIQDLLEGMVVYLSENGPASSKEVFFPELSVDNESAAKQYKLTASDDLGVQMAVRYGLQLKLLVSGREVKDRENLSRLLRLCGYALSLQQRSSEGDRELKTVEGRYKGFDWFVVSIFLLVKGNREKSWSFLQKVSTLLLSAYMWPARLHRSNNLPTRLALCGISPLFSSVCHWVELILQVNLPLIHSAFKMSGFTAAEICQHWLKQAFWCYLDWVDISHYLALCLVMGGDYQVYICVAILRSLSDKIFYHQQNQSLMLFLKEEPLGDFHVGAHMEFMQDLEKQFRKPLMADLYNLTKP